MRLAGLEGVAVQATGLAFAHQAGGQPEQFVVVVFQHHIGHLQYFFEGDQQVFAHALELDHFGGLQVWLAEVLELVFEALLHTDAHGLPLRASARFDFEHLGALSRCGLNKDLNGGCGHVEGS